MIGSYLKVAARNLWKRKLYTAINVAGLATGVACFILLVLYLQNEWTYDRFFQQVDQLYRIRVDYGEKDQPVIHTAMTPSGLAPVLKDFPEVKYVSRAYHQNSTVKYGNTAIKEEKFLYADPAFFQVFSFHLREGNAATVLNGPNMLVMTASAAKKYFGTENPVGKTVRVDNQDMQVTGITDDAPSNTHLKYEFVASWASLRKKDNWNAPNYYTYVQLNDHVTAVALQARLGNYLKNVLLPQMGGSNGATLDMMPEPVTIALCVASPLAWLAMNRWLGDFAYHTTLSAWIFLAGGMIAIVIAFLTVSVQSLKAARINPVISLRSE